MNNSAVMFLFHVFLPALRLLCPFLLRFENQKVHLAERGFDPRTSGLWAQHASTAPLCSAGSGVYKRYMNWVDLPNKSMSFRESSSKPPPKMCSPRRGIEPRSPAWQAGILTTILPRTRLEPTNYDGKYWIICFWLRPKPQFLFISIWISTAQTVATQRF